MQQNWILHAHSRHHYWSGAGALSIKSFTQGQAYYEVGAARYLVTDYSVTEICFAVGFASLGSFSWLFRRRVGLSPTSFAGSNLGDFEEACPPAPCYDG